MFVLDDSVAPVDQLATIDGKLVLVIDNCTVRNDSTCPPRHCCTKKVSILFWHTAILYNPTKLP